MTDRTRWGLVVGYAAAMAWVESAVVYYLRTMINRIVPYQPDPLPVIGGLGLVEMVRELATLLMLAAVGVLAGRTWRSRAGYFAIAFGVWDIGYYLFLKVMCGWPQSLLDWDILFLLPLPWWGPVLAPMLVALLMIVWGTLLSQFEETRTNHRPSLIWGLSAWISSSGGVALALYVFMADSIRVAHGGVPALRSLLPAQFKWPLFVVALALVSVPIAERLFRLRRVSLPRSEESIAIACNQAR
jgi:hypothetical protein